MTNFIRCQDCGQPYETKRKNTKYCRICRLSRNVEYFATKRMSCWKCDERFAPFDTKQVFCGGCCFKPANVEQVVCGFCKQERTPVAEGVAVCHGCMTDPAKRQALIKALAKKVAKRKESPDEPVPEVRDEPTAEAVIV